MLWSFRIWSEHALCTEDSRLRRGRIWLSQKSCWDHVMNKVAINIQSAQINRLVDLIRWQTCILHTTGLPWRVSLNQSFHRTSLSHPLVIGDKMLDVHPSLTINQTSTSGYPIQTVAFVHYNEHLIKMAYISMISLFTLYNLLSSDICILSEIQTIGEPLIWTSQKLRDWI